MSTERLAAAEPIFPGLPCHAQGAMGMKGLEALVRQTGRKGA